MADVEMKGLAVITGASSGIGYELAREFAAHGFDLVVAAEDAALVEAAQALAQLGGLVVPVRVDLAKPEGVETLWARVVGLGRPIDAVAINAGVGVGGPFSQTRLEDELNLVSLNCTSAVHLAKRAVQHMIARGEGRILFTSSIVATMPSPFEAAYGASKAFLLSFSEALRNELQDKGITVTALMPGATETKFFERAGLEDTKVGVAKKDDPAVVARQGYDAMMAGKDKVVAGSLKNKVEAAVAQVLPRPAAAAINRGQVEPGSAKK